MKNKRVFLIVIDSLGIGYDPTSVNYGDEGANTLSHIFEATGGKYKIPTLQRLGLCNLTTVKGNDGVTKPESYICRLNEQSTGKDTMTGHWEFMGVLTTEPFVTFTDTGFPQELIDELSRRSGHSFIGNVAASGTEIIKELGERQLATKEMILYTSADSVLQIAANEELYGLDEIYRTCEIARDITMKKEWRVGRVIARPFIGNSSSNFERTSNRHDYALSPSEDTVLDHLKNALYDVISIGKINDIFNGKGITQAIRSKSSVEGMEQTIEVAKSDFNGLCFVNLVDFDAKWGHRRNPDGYAQELVAFDEKLAQLLNIVNDDDVVMICADHGNDPTWKGSDHTREMIPWLIYSKNYQEPKALAEGYSFANIGATIADLFDVKMPTIGESVLKDLK